MFKSAIAAVVAISCVAFIPPLTVHASPLVEGPAEMPALAKTIEDGLRAGDIELVFGSFDIDAFTERANRTMPQDSKLTVATTNDLLKGVKQQLSAQRAQLAGAKFLRTQTVDGEQRLLYRMTGDGITYIAFITAPGPQGPIVNDVYMTSLGELMSEMCARIMLRAKLAEDSNDESFISDANLVMKMNQAIQQGKPQEAMQYYDQLGNLKKDRIVQVTRLQVVSGLDDVKLLDQVCSEFLERFPNDIAGDLFMIDAYITMDQYDKALAAVDRIDRNVGGDPYLCLIRGNLKSMQGDRAAAQAELLKGIEADPTLTDIANALADHALQDNDFAALKRWLLHLEKYCNYEFNDDLNNAAEFEAFKKSAEYQAWLKEKKP